MDKCEYCNKGIPVKMHMPWPRGSKPMAMHELDGGKYFLCKLTDLERRNLRRERVANYKFQGE